MNNTNALAVNIQAVSPEFNSSVKPIDGIKVNAIIAEI